MTGTTHAEHIAARRVETQRGELDHFDLQACRTLMRGGSKTFFAASLLLPPRVRLSATALYAFCRVADDLIDEGQDKAAAMQELTARLDEIYAARPRSLDSDLALALVVHQHAIPRALLDALLEGFAWDAEHRRYETLGDLQAYAARVAATVGAMMTLIMGVRKPEALARACDLGVAMQLTNIARDVGEDARAGRLYLPLRWLREEGVDPQTWLRQPRFEPAIARVVARLLAQADRLYERAEGGISQLPRDCQSAIRAAGLVYAEIGREVERRHWNSVDSRAVVSSQRKLLLVGKALASSTRSRRGPPSMQQPSALPATRFLVEASLQMPLASASCGGVSEALQNEPEDGIAWMIDLFERREHQRRRTGRAHPPADPVQA